MKLTLCALVATLVLTSGCGNTGPQGASGIQGPAGPVAVQPTPISDEQAEVNTLVASENSYREGLGQTVLTAGLSCTLYTITGGTYIYSSSLTGASQSPTLSGVSQVATFLLTQSFNQPDAPVSAGLNTLPAALMNNPAYQNLIKLTCTGQIVVTVTGYVQFDLYSDDGSVLTIDGSRLVDNDGNHGIAEKSGSKYLRQGVHTFRLDFAQTGAGNEALILNGNGSLIDPMYFYH